jgi:hypothetical protein
MRPICTAARVLSTQFLGCQQEGLFVYKKLQVLQVCRCFCLQTVGYDIGIDAGVVRQLSKLNSK